MNFEQAFPNQKFKQKVQRVRFVYIFSVSFMLVWFPFGFLLGITIIQYRVPFSFFENFPDFTMYLWGVVYFYIMAIPIIILLTNEGISQLTLKFQCGDVPASPTSIGDPTKCCEIKVSSTSAVEETFNQTSSPQPEVSFRNPIFDTEDFGQTELNKPEAKNATD